jgi:thiamine pyrophosphate-dependent acetolactate synthase large subunit-like protein
MEKLKCKECGSTEIYMFEGGTVCQCMDCLLFSDYNTDELANKSWNIYAAEVRNIDVEANELIEKIKEIYPIVNNIQKTIGSLLEQIVEFVRRNHN